jgi:hypothetical protein
MNPSPYIDIDRREGIYLLVKTFLTKSVIMRGAIADDIERIDTLLCGCVRDRALVTELEVWYLSTAADAEVVEKEGQVAFHIDWGAHRLEVKSGRRAFGVSEEELLGSMSPVYARVADEIRRNCICDGVCELFWVVRWVDTVYANRELQAQLRRQYRIGGEYGERMTAAERAYRGSARGCQCAGGRHCREPPRSRLADALRTLRTQLLH